jgi:hypothetical protein
MGLMICLVLFSDYQLSNIIVDDVPKYSHDYCDANNRPVSLALKVYVGVVLVSFLLAYMYLTAKLKMLNVPDSFLNFQLAKLYQYVGIAVAISGIVYSAIAVWLKDDNLWWSLPSALKMTFLLIGLVALYFIAYVETTTFLATKVLNSNAAWLLSTKVKPSDVTKPLATISHQTQTMIRKVTLGRKGLNPSQMGVSGEIDLNGTATMNDAPHVNDMTRRLRATGKQNSAPLESLYAETNNKAIEDAEKEALTKGANKPREGTDKWYMLLLLQHSHNLHAKDLLAKQCTQKVMVEMLNLFKIEYSIDSICFRGVQLGTELEVLHEENPAELAKSWKAVIGDLTKNGIKGATPVTSLTFGGMPLRRKQTGSDLLLGNTKLVNFLLDFEQKGAGGAGGGGAMKGKPNAGDKKEDLKSPATPTSPKKAAS